MSEYYLHENGCLIYKPHGGVDASSSFVKRVWPASYMSESPDSFVEWLREAYQAGAKKSEIERLAKASYIENHIFDWKSAVYGNQGSTNE